MNDQPFEPDLTSKERSALVAGLGEWLGPIARDHAVAVAVRFLDFERLQLEVPRIATAIAAGAPLSSWDWRRAIAATEVAFSSDFLGSGTDWTATTGLSDGETLAFLRAIQRKWLSS